MLRQQHALCWLRFVRCTCSYSSLAFVAWAPVVAAIPERCQVRTCVGCTGQQGLGMLNPHPSNGTNADSSRAASVPTQFSASAPTLHSLAKHSDSAGGCCWHSSCSSSRGPPQQGGWAGVLQAGGGA